VVGIEAIEGAQMGQTAGSRRRDEDIADLIERAARMPASRLILEIAARGHDPVRVLNELPPETLGL
jgi:hypothetical protein